MTRIRHAWPFWVGLALAALAVVAPASAQEPVGERRYAVMISANRGRAGEETLRYATADAQRLGGLLRRMGGFLEEDMLVLEQPTLQRLRSAVTRVNARLRAEQTPGRRTLLLVYYSGHADAASLHLGDESLPWDELRDLTLGSAADMRLLILDACHSGRATRVKGAVAAAPFALPQQAASAPEGFAILSSATATEQAQESDALRASLFTHHLLAALRGAADDDADGAVSLDEAYRYATSRTVASTARTQAGLQHPTYQYALRGRSEVVLTQPRGAQDQAALGLQGSGTYLFYRGDAAGVLELEATLQGRARELRLPPGRYFVQVRRQRVFYEGEVVAVAGTTTPVGLAQMRRVEYAQLVRKGGAPRWVTSLGLLTGYQAPILHYRGSPLVGLGLSFESSAVIFDLQTAYAAGWRNEAFGDSMLHAWSFAAGARYAWDVKRWTLSVGGRVGVDLAWQVFSGERTAPTRRQAMPWLSPVLRADVHWRHGWYNGLEGLASVVFLEQAAAQGGSDAQVAWRPSLALITGRSW